MAINKVIIRVKHRTDCHAINAVLRGDWDSPWYITGEIWNGDKRGGHRSTWTRWQPFKCNDTNCPAHGDVMVDWLERLIFVGSRTAAMAAKAEDVIE